MPIKDGFRSSSGKLPAANARVNNMQNVSVDIPIGVLTVVTGVAGAAVAHTDHLAGDGLRLSSGRQAQRE
jgi:hypothetical protein